MWRSFVFLLFSTPALASVVYNPFTNNFDFSGGAGTVTGVTATAPISSTGGAAPVISCITATGSVAGCLTAAAQTIGGVKTFNRNLVVTNAVDNATPGSPTLITTGEPTTVGLSIAGSTGTTASAPGSTFFATYATSVNATSSTGVGTGTASNGAAISGGLLDLTGGVALKNVQYAAAGNIDQTQTFTVRLNYKPAYTGNPAARQYIWVRTSAGGPNALIQLFHETDGTLNLSVLDSGGSTLGNLSFGGWSPTSGTTYELETDIDLNGGAQRLFIDGTQKGSTGTDTGTSTVSSGVFRLGKTHDTSGDVNTSYANFSVSNLVVYSSVQHTANFTGEVPRTYASAQTGDLQRWVSSGGSTLAHVAYDGTATFPNLAGLASSFMSFSSGLTTVLTANEILAAGKTVRAMTVENFTGAASVLNTCTVNPTVKLYDCGTSTGACTSGTTEMAAVTISAANTTTAGTISSANIAAGHYWAFLLTAGSCVSIDATGNAEAIMQ